MPANTEDALYHMEEYTIKTCSCWLWIGTKTVAGYGWFMFKGKMKYCHRFVMEELGHDLTNKVVMHACDNPSCVNPDHLVVGTHADNVADKVSKNRHCYGQKCNLTKLTDEQVKGIKRDLMIGGLMQKQIAAKYGTTQSNVAKINTGVSRKRV